MRELLFSAFFVLLTIGSINAQTRPIAEMRTAPAKDQASAENIEGFTVSPISTSTASGHVFVPSLLDLVDPPPLTEEEKERNHEVKEEREKELNADRSVRNYPFKEMDIQPDAAWQQVMGTTPMNTNHAPLINFAGQNSFASPPDCNGAAGPNHFMQGVNSTYAIYNKTGGAAIATGNFNTLFNGVAGASRNDGDPIVIYDDQADRWLIAEFSLDGTYGSTTDRMLVAVSQTNDPTGAWNAYSFDVADMPDYMKFGVWRDGYYMSTNNGSGGDVYVFERDVMIAGGASPQMVEFDNPNRPNSGFHCIMPLDNDGAFAPVGTPGQFITINDGAWGGSDQLWIYELDVDWTNIGAATFSRTQTLAVTAFDSDFGASWDNISQQGTTQKVDAIPQILMYRTQYRNFGTVQTIVCAHTVDVDNTDRAGIRWYELQNTGSGWSVRQQGTYSPDDQNRWIPSIAMDANRNIGLAYNVAGSTTYPSIRYCGQSATENASATGNLDIAEEVIIDGTSSETSNNRWGDYAQLSLDPTDDLTFWSTSQYSNDKTRIASFMFAPSTTKPNTNFQVNTPSTLLRPVPILEGDIVTYTDLTTGDVDTYAWTFDGGAPGSAGTQDPGNITYNTAGLYTTTLSAGNAFGDSILPKADLINVLDPAVETCDLVGQFYGNATLYGTTGNAYLSGTNEFNLTKFSDKFENYTPYNKLTGGRVFWGQITNATSPNVTFAVWQDNGSGLPGTLLESKDISLATLLTDFTTDGYTDVVFDNEVILPTGAFYLGIIMPTQAAGDTLAIITNTDADGPDNTAFMEYTGSWDSYENLVGITVMHAIFPNLCYVPNPPPGADFVADQTNVTAGTTVNFTDLSVNTPTSWAWDFGDGNTSILQNPSNQYTADGLYTVTLTVTNAGGSDTETKMQYIVVDSQTYCASTYTQAGSEYILNVEFNTINNSSGDAATDGYEDYTSISTTVTPSSTHTLNVTLNTAGNYTDYVEAYFDWNDDGDWADAGEMVDLGTQTNQTAGVATANVTVPAAASLSAIRMRINIEYNVAPGICDADHSSEWGETEDYTVIISPPTPAPVAAFSGTPLTICSGESVTFTDASTNTPTSWAWNFGDGNASTQQNPSNTYATAGTYTVTLTASNVGGSDDEIKTSYVTVNAATAITGQPANATECEGANVTFTVTATGSNLSYQWKKGATNVGTDNASYTITGITAADAANYTCVVAGDCGTATSNVATLTVNPATAITGQPSGATQCEGTNVTFTVTATGSSLSYQWKKGAANVGTDNASYTITGITPADAANYTCVVTGDCGSVTSSVATLVVTPATAITAQPSGATECEGTNVTFTVTATGSNLSYQWKKGAANVGADNASYTITGITAADAANYTCVVTGDCGTVTSSIATLVVTPATAITGQPSGATECEGANVTFTVTATGSNLSYQWKKDAANVGPNNASYTIAGVTAADAANYTCVITGDCGTVTSSVATLAVNAATVITAQPSGTTLCEGADITFTITATGSNLSYQWKKGTSNVGTDNASYTLTGITAADAADYTCVVTGDCGNITSNIATLIVNPLPVAASSVSATETNTCTGDPTTLSYVGGSGTTFNWHTGSCGSSLVGSGNNLSVSPTTTTTYYGRWENSCGNSTCQAVTITVDDMPNLNTSSTNTNCGSSTGTTTVIATGGTGSYTYLWDDLSAQNTATATGLGQGVYNVIVTSGACQANASATVDENGAPNVSVSASLTTICAGETTVLTASGADSYVWTPATDLDATTGAVVNASPTADITYSVTGTTAGCSASSSVDITVGPTTTITGQPMSVSECEGADVTFTVTATGSGLSYQWKKGTNNVGPNNPSFSVTGITAADAADYTCVVTGDCGSETSSIATLTVNPTTAITNQPMAVTECEGNNVTFTVQATGSNLSYQWKKGTSNVGTDNASYTITGIVASDADDYTCVVTGDCGTETSNIATLVVNLLPTAASSASASETVVCIGTPTTLSYVGGTGTTFNWYTNTCGDVLEGSGNNLSVSPTTTTTYYGRWENSCGNSTCQTVTITVDDMPNLNTSATNTDCGSSTGTATVVATGGTGSYTYLWDDLSAQNTATATGLGQGIYNVVVTSGACQANASATVNENGAPIVSVSATETVICEGETTVLTATGADTYGWTPSTGLDATTGTVVNATPTADITYSVTGTTAGCSASATIDITVNHTPTVGFTIDASGEPVINFTNTTTGADSYSWDLGDATTETTTDVSHEYTTNGTFTVVLSATNGCGTVTDQQDVIITNIGIAGIDKESIKIYPNPAETILNINLPIENVKIQLVNMDGKTLKAIESKDAKHVELNVEDLATGFYNLIITTESGEQVIVKVVKK